MVEHAPNNKAEAIYESINHRAGTLSEPWVPNWTKRRRTTIPGNTNGAARGWSE